MRDLVDGRHENETMFIDGIITIIWKDLYNPLIDDYDYKIERYMLYPEYTHPISLSDILNGYPSVTMVIHETANEGAIYRYDNHYDGEWEKVGTTVGYA